MQQSQLQSNSQELSSIFNLSVNGYKALQKSGLTLDQMFYLELIIKEVDTTDIVGKDRIMTWQQSLRRKGYLTEKGEATLDGFTLWKEVGVEGEPFCTITERRAKAESDFERWWRTFPSNDTFEYQGQKFLGSRSLKRGKSESKAKFEEIVNEGEFSGEDIIRSLECEVELKKQLSIKEKVNKMCYMTNSLSWLNQRQFEGFVETSKKPLSSNSQITQEDI